jgi:HEAT repeat protein
MRLRWIALSFLGALTACSPAREPFALRAVVASAIAGLSSQVPAAPTATPPELEARARKVLGAFTNGGSVELEDLVDAAALGEASIPFLASELRAKNASVEHRGAVLAMLGPLQSEVAADVIVRELAESGEPSVRASAALALAVSGKEHVVPAMLEQLFVEADSAVVREIAFALCILGNHSGVARLAELQAHDPAAKGELESALEHAKQVNPSAQWDNLRGSAAEILDRVWSNGDPQRLLSTNNPTPRQRLEVWRRIALLSTRAADAPPSADESLDPRERERRATQRRNAAEYALANGAPWTAELLAAALHDEDRGVREGAARALGRMGWRARAAATALVAALDEPSIAAESAKALGWIGEPQATEALVRALASDSDPVRAAAASALGSLGAESASDSLRAVLKGREPVESRIAAASALTRLGHGDETEPVLIELLEKAEGDLTDVETLLEERLVAAKRDGRPGAIEALKAWLALRPPPSIAADAPSVAQRYRERAKVLRSRPAAGSH